MKDIEKIDKNFRVETKIVKADIKFYSVLCDPFKLYGVFYQDGHLCRLPERVAKNVSEGVHQLYANTAGGRVRFRTDSPYIAISVKYNSFAKMSHFALEGSAGFDLYVGKDYRASFIPPHAELEEGYEKVVELGKGDMREITLNLPLYSDIKELYIGLSDTANISAPTPYKFEDPIVYYGSSITQGGCASRPGTSYQGFCERALDANFINLGFSGSAKAENAIIEYIKTLKMSIFVYDYDHNTPNSNHLMATHEKTFLAIREANPDLPIVIMSRPKVRLSAVEKEYLEIIKATYENALSRGDKNVYFIDGKALMAICGDEGTVDGCHPTDLGFYSMAQALIPVLKKCLKISE
ncbi:MAG: hypothetical protein IKV16_00205 [Clostridia bacterium]|nr:hypothetical protein [Clostridia bacterium]